MPMELRKRKAPTASPATRPSKKKASEAAPVGAAKKAAAAARTKVEKATKKSSAGVGAGDKAAAKKRAAAPKEVNGKKAGAPKVEAPVEPVQDDNETEVADEGNDIHGVAGAVAAPAPGPASVPKEGDVVDLESFGGTVQTQDGEKVTLKQLAEKSKAGVVLFTYPKASTPGCTKQACLFRDGYDTLTSSGLAIYGLSGDSPKANLSFKTKKELQYTLLCDPEYSLIGAIGTQAKPAKKTIRGVWAVDKKGKVLLAIVGGPQVTVDAVKHLVDKMNG